MSERTVLRRRGSTLLAATVLAAGAVVMVGAGPSPAASATHPLVPADLAASDPGLYGWTAAIDGDTVVVTAHLQDAAGVNAGAAYIFNRTAGNWAEGQKLLGAAGDHFGRGAGLDGNLLAIGAPGPDDTGTGHVNVYTRSGGTFTQQATLTVPGLVSGDIFGYEVAVQEGNPSTIAVSARGDDTDRGAVYVFTGAGASWTLQSTLRADDRAAGDEFGKSIGLDGDVIVVGADRDDRVVFEAGSAYVYRRTNGTWNQEAHLDAGAEIQINNAFGFSVAIQGQRIVVGARLADAGAVNQAGSATVFTTTGGGVWTQEQRLTASDATDDSRFGTSVAIDGGRIVVGAPERGGDDAGGVYVFTFGSGTWSQTDQVTAPTPVAGGRLGWRVTIAGASVLAGGPDFPPPATRGETFVFDEPGGTIPVPPATPPPTTPIPPTVRADRYWVVTAGGDVASFGGAPDLGDVTVPDGDRAVAIASTPDGRGWWVTTAAGRVTARGNALAYGDTSAKRLNAPIVGMAATTDGRGYWLLGADGGIFSYGPSARFYGSTGGKPLNRPVVGMAATTGGGYWFVAADGGIFSFGPGALFYGSMGGRRLNQPVVGMAATPGGGYRLVARDGGIFAFGPDTLFYGSTGGRTLVQPVVGMTNVVGAQGYWMVAADGGVFTFGPDARFAGSLAGGAATPVVGLAA